ncbi:hypothetical protein Droror1_Dr00004168 [Drosera rotundifolia]
MEHKTSKESEMNNSHVLLFPNPQPGHISPFLDLAELLCLSGLPHVTFLTTLQMQHRLLNHSNTVSRFAPYPGFQLEGISDGLSPSDSVRTVKEVIDSYRSLYTTTKDLLKAMLASGALGGGDNHRPQVTCFIADGSLEFLMDVAEQFNIPVISFHTYSAATTWLTFCVPEIIQEGKLPFAGDDDGKIRTIKGLEGLLRAKDMGTSPKELGQFILSSAARHQQTKATIFNTFEELEGSILTYIRTRCPSTYAIGPLHTHLAHRSSQSLSSSSILQEDKSCMKWLDSQPMKTVVYVSFGSQAVLKKEEFLELWHGLISSGKKFLWVMRERLAEEELSRDQMEKESDGRGYVVSWAPQRDVLAHPAIGCFLTHCGWNSVLEGLVAGVPMICWPHYGDQQLNGRCVSEVYKIGVYLKDYPCERDAIARVVNQVMGQKKKELGISSESLAASSKKAVSEGGSSFNIFHQLVDFIGSLVHEKSGI